MGAWDSGWVRCAGRAARPVLSSPTSPPPPPPTHTTPSPLPLSRALRLHGREEDGDFFLGGQFSLVSASRCAAAPAVGSLWAPALATAARGGAAAGAGFSTASLPDRPRQLPGRPSRLLLPCCSDPCCRPRWAR